MATRKQKKAAPKKRKRTLKKKKVVAKKKPVVKRKKPVVKQKKRKAPRTPARTTPEEREVDVERTQQLSFSEIIGDIEERQALDRIGESK